MSSPRSSPTPYQTLAPDKPLPSLPVATIVSTSPVHRRSIIDATERQLVRRSLSPQFGDEETEEWPALSPVRPASATDKRQQSAIKPSVGESVIEGFRHLNIADDNRTERHQPRVSTEEPISTRDSFRDPILQPRCSTPSSLDSPETSINSASSAESVSHTSTTVIASCSKPARNVRHTKTSAMRMRLSGGSMDGEDQKYEASPTPQSVSNGSKSLKIEKSRGHGPVRSSSRSRHAATPRGSPYLIPSQSKVKLVEIKRKPVAVPDASCARPDARSGSNGSTEDVRHSQLIAVKHVKRTVSGKRSASVPLPSRLIRQYPEGESEGDVDAPQLRKTSETQKQLGDDSQDADIDTEPEPNKSRVEGQGNGHAQSSQPAKQKSNLFSFSELMTTPPPAADESHFSSDSDNGSVHGYDEDGGFKIKKLRSNGKKGATLRISDDAHHLLSPDHDDSDGVGEEPGMQNKRSSITDLRQAVVIKEHLRRSGEFIKTQVHLTRSITERSLARLSGASSRDGDTRSESEYSVPENGGIGQEEVHSSSVELPAESAGPHEVASTPTSAVKGEGTDDQTVGTPSSAGQGDWPFKDFKTFATSTPTPTEASLSPWIPPPDWDVNMPQCNTSVVDEESATPCPRVPHNTPANGADHKLEDPHSSELLKNGHDRIPTPTPNHFSRPGSRAASTDLVKRPFPPRTTSKQSVQNSTSRVPSNLSPVKESPGRPTGLRQPSKSYGKQLPILPEPKHAKSFSESIGDIKQSLEAVRPTSSASKVPAPATSGKKAMSTLRGLFHKKSYEFRSGSRRGKKSAAEATPKSSPLLATPTPFPKPPSSVHRGFSPLHFDALTPVRSKSIAQRKPIPAFPKKSSTSAPMVQNSSMEPPEICFATQTALKLLDLARDERPGARQNLLVEVSIPPKQVFT